MRTIRVMTAEEQQFAEYNHDLVLEFLRRKKLPAEDFYDIIIFGYLSAIQQYLRNPPAGVPFRAMAFRAMKDSVLRDREYNTRAKRHGYVIGFDGLDNHDALVDPRQDTQRQVEDKALLEQAAKAATPEEAPIIRLLVDGFALNEAARLLKISRPAAETRMREFYGRARSAIG